MCSIQPGYAAGQPNVHIILSEVNVTEGELFGAAITIENVTGLFGYQYSVHFNPEVLAIESVEQGDFLSAGDTSSTFYITPNLTSPGIISLVAEARLRQPGVSGSGVLGTVMFRGAHTGMGEIRLVDLKLSDSSAQLMESKTESAAMTIGAGTVRSKPVAGEMVFIIPLEGRNSNALREDSTHRTEVTIGVLDAGGTVVDSRTLETDATGMTQLLLSDDVRFDTAVTFTAHAAGYLTGVVREVVLSHDRVNRISFLPLIFGDIAGVTGDDSTDSDCVINSADISELYLRWGMRTDGAYEGDYDGNGFIGAEDFVFLQRNIGKRCDAVS